MVWEGLLTSEAVVYAVFTVLMVLIMIFGWTVPLVLSDADDRRRGRRVRRLLAGPLGEPRLLGLLSQGPDGMVDTIVVELVERGAVRAEHGALAVVPDHRERIITAGCGDPVEQRVFEAILEVGAAGLGAVRGYVTATPALFVKRLRRLARRRLLITTGRRIRHVATHCLVTTAAVTAVTIGVFLTNPDPPPGEQNPIEIAIIVAVQLGWLIPITVIGVTVRRGYHGADRISSLGQACLDKARDDLVPDSPQAHRVALWDIASMWNHPLRDAIAGSTDRSALIQPS